MLKTNYLLILLLAASTPSRADIEVDNQSDYPIRISFHGDICRLFEADRYEYVPCEQQEIPANGTAFFKSMDTGHSALNQKESAIAPRILFSSFGFSYACRISTKDDDLEYTFLSLGGVSLFVDKDYFLTIHKDYGYFPLPYVRCDIQTTSDD